MDISESGIALFSNNDRDIFVGDQLKAEFIGDKNMSPFIANLEVKKPFTTIPLHHNKLSECNLSTSLILLKKHWKSSSSNSLKKVTPKYSSNLFFGKRIEIF